MCCTHTGPYRRLLPFPLQRPRVHWRHFAHPRHRPHRFQNGDPVAQYGSLFDKLPKLPEDTLVYPGHDYKGDTVSTIAEERAFNPRLQVASLDEYVDIMNNLNLDNPKMMDVAVPANLKIGMSQESVEARGWGLSCEELQCSIDSGEELILVDLRESTEQRRHGVIPDSVHAPYPNTETNVAAGGLLRELTGSTGRRHVSRLTYRPRSEYSSGTERVTPKGSSMSTDENKAANKRKCVPNADRNWLALTGRAGVKD